MADLSDADAGFSPQGATMTVVEPNVVDTQSRQPLSDPGQVATARALAAAGGYDASAAPGSSRNPYHQAPNTMIPEGAYYIPSGGGGVQRAPAGGVATPAPDMGDAQAGFGQAQNGALNLKPDEAWGLGKGLARDAGNAGFAADAFNRMNVLNPGGMLLTGALDHLFGRPETGNQMAAGVDQLAAAQGKAPGKWGEFGGEALGAIPLMGIEGPALAGAAAGALTTHSDNPLGVAKDVALGALGGRIGDKVVRTVADAAAPVITPAARWLMDRGVTLTPGQAMGGVANSMEQKAQSLPLLGEKIAESRAESTGSFRHALANAVLEPLGQTVPDDLGGVHAMVQHIQDATGAAYDGALPNMSATLDPEWQSALLGMKPSVDVLPETNQGQLARAVQTYVRDRIGPDGALSGDQLQAAHSDLGTFGGRYSTSSMTGDRDMGDAALSLRDSLMDAASRQNPELADHLQSANAAYARQVRFETAAAKRPDGAFSPAQFAQAVRQGGTRRTNAAGDALMQDWADNGVNVLGSTVPDSGTAGRGMLAALLLEGSHALHNPVALASTVGAMLPYTKMGRSAAQAWMNAGPGRQALAQAIRAGRLPATFGGALALPAFADAGPAAPQ